MSVKGRIWRMGRKKAQRATGRASNKFRRELVALKKRHIERCSLEHANEHINEHEYDG